MTNTDEELTFTDPELRAMDGALRNLAAETQPRPAFVAATVAHLRRETLPGQPAPMPTHAAHTPTSGTSTRAETIPRPTRGVAPHKDHGGRGAHPLYTQTAPPVPAGRPLTRRHFLIGSAAAVATTAALLHGGHRWFSPSPPPATAPPRLTNITAAMIGVGEPTPVAASALAQPRNLDFADALSGWGLWGSRPQDYTYGIDPQVAQAGVVSAYLAGGIADPQGFGTLAQTFLPDPWRGLRIRMSANVKAENVADWAGLWMRVDGPGNQSLSFDNMHPRPITGTRDWQRYSIVLDVPPESTLVAFGILLSKQGRVWIDGLTFEAVGADVPTTDLLTIPKQMANLDFAQGTTGWFLAGDAPADYRIAPETDAPQGRAASASLASQVETPSGFGTLMQIVQAGSHRGERLRMSAWVRTEDVADWAGLWMRVDGPDAATTHQSLSFDNMQDRPIKGTSEWTHYAIVLDVPVAGVAIAFGILLHGKGELWLADVQFTSVGGDTPVTGARVTG